MTSQTGPGGPKPQTDQQYGTNHGKPATENPAGGAKRPPGAAEVDGKSQPQDRQIKDGKAQTEQARHQDKSAEIER
jgi:hypothetical protein